MLHNILRTNLSGFSLLRLQVSTDNPGLDLLDSSGKKKAQRCKRPARSEKDRAPPKYKRRKKEDEKVLQASTPSSEQLVTHLRQVTQHHLLLVWYLRSDKQNMEFHVSMSSCPSLITAVGAAPHGASSEGGSEPVPPMRQLLSGPNLQTDGLLW